MGKTDQQLYTAEHKAWYSRGYLPHFDQPGVIQSITFRLFDSLPRHIVLAMEQDVSDEDDAVKWKKVESFLDAGVGACYLGDPRIATVVENALLHFDGQRYRLLAWVVLPNHVHVLIELADGFPLRRIVHSWKSFTANVANEILGREGQFWYADYFDRYIRSMAHFGHTVAYIHNNPVKAGLVETPELWRFSSARLWSDK